MDEYEPDSYVELRTVEVPLGWSNHPSRLQVGKYFTHNGEYIRSVVQPSYHFPRIRPILADVDCTNFIFEGGDGRYYHWNDTCGNVWQIEESSLQDILAKLERGLNTLTSSRLRTIW